MASRVLKEGNRYKAKLDRTLRDQKVSRRESKALLADATDGKFSQVQAHYLTGFVTLPGTKKDKDVHAGLVKFVRDDMRALAKLATGNGLAEAVDLPDISPEVRRRGAKYSKLEGGRLFTQAVHFDDPLQGDVGDCYLIAALSALAKVRPSIIRDAVRANDDGTFTVTLFEPSPGKRARKREITVTGLVPQLDGEPVFARGRDLKELWPVIIEKAYAARKGTYLRIEGGMSANVFEILTGKRPDWFPVGPDLEPDKLFARLDRLHSKGAAIVALSNAWKTGQGVTKDHAFTVLDVFEKNGQRYVTLRNPWGDDEPKGNGKRDGIFTLTFEQFLASMTTVELLEL